MNKEKQRIAIAEACGWTDIKFHDETSPLLSKWNPHYEPGLYGKSPNPNWSGLAPIPDYLNNLGAMHEAEERMGALEPGARRRYAELLRDWLGANGSVFATAAQRAESFLKTLGLWTEEE